MPSLDIIDIISKIERSIIVNRTINCAELRMNDSAAIGAYGSYAASTERKGKMKKFVSKLLALAMSASLLSGFSQPAFTR